MLGAQRGQGPKNHPNMQRLRRARRTPLKQGCGLGLNGGPSDPVRLPSSQVGAPLPLSGQQEVCFLERPAELGTAVRGHYA